MRATLMPETTSTMTQTACRRVRIGAVSYLNSKPLVAGLDELAPYADVIFDVPSRLADALAADELHVALLPSIECLRHGDYEVVSDACVATRGPVLSVNLYSRVPIDRIRSLALDAGSRTSAALVRILLAERYGVQPTVEPLPLGRSVDATDADAILLIGDRGMRPVAETFRTTWDLGEEWLRWTGLPFVFALWTAKTGTDLGDLGNALNRARDRGVQNIGAIARSEAGSADLSEREVAEYLTKNLHYDLGAAERQGLSLFQDLAVKRGLAPEGNDLVFRDCAFAG